MALKVLDTLDHDRTYRVGGTSDLEALPDEFARLLGKFVLLIAVDGAQLADDQVIHVAQNLIDLGLCYLCVWGPDCERIHDLFDRVIVQQNPNESVDTVIMTTWHDESLSDAIWYFRNCAWPAETFAPQCSEWIAVAIDNSEWTNQIEKGLVALT